VIFTALAVVLGVLGLTPFVRFAILQLEDNPGGHIQSLLVGAVLLIMSFLSMIIGIISDLIRTNRILIEDTLEHTKKMRFGKEAELSVDLSVLTASELSERVETVGAARRYSTR
ncbi:MAG: hypothetical protein ABJA87_07560, partial [bacterium]